MPCPPPRSNATQFSGRGYLAGMAFWDCSNITLTSSNGRGELYGNGRAWWSLPGIGYLLHQEYRPRLLTVASSRGVLIENLLFRDSPYWTTLFERVEELEALVQEISISDCDSVHKCVVSTSKHGCYADIGSGPITPISCPSRR